MTKFPYDQFAKEFLEELLKPLGEVKAPREVKGEVRQIDVWFAPVLPTTADALPLGLLGLFAATPALFEPFRNPATVTEICNCILKLLELRGELQREANRNQERLLEKKLPKLWIITPTVSESIIRGFRGILDEENWGSGVYFLADHLRTAIVAIHQLPRTEETLWLRLLGRGRVQEQAIDELQKLPRSNSLRLIALRLVTNLNANLQSSENIDEDDRRLIMKLSPLYVQWEQEAQKQGQRMIVENLLTVRFGTLDEQLATIIQPILELPSQEYASLLLQLSNLSREDLLVRFNSNHS
ncbi:MAG: hypothetical protein RM021_017915 [Nostoc sp. EkiNYC01]|nr:hypothetical protein [Nostoc sp. EkiNYC01]